MAQKSKLPIIIGVSSAAILGLIALTSNASAATPSKCFQFKTGAPSEETSFTRRFDAFSANIPNGEFYALVSASAGSATSNAKLNSLMCDLVVKVPRLFAVSIGSNAVAKVCQSSIPLTDALLCGSLEPSDIACLVRIYFKDANGVVSQIAQDSFKTTEAGLKADILQSLKDNMVKPQPKPPASPAYNPTDPYAPSVSVCYTNGEPYNALLFPDAAGVVDAYRRIAGIKADNNITPPEGYNFGDLDVLEVYKSDGMAKTPVFKETVDGGFDQDAAASSVLQAFQSRAKQDGVYQAKVDGIIGECTMRALETVLVRAYNAQA